VFVIFEKIKRRVKRKLSKVNLRKLLELEKRRRGVDTEQLVFIGMADVANFYWCAMKSLLNNREMELAYFASYLYDRLLYSLELGYVKRIPKEEKKLLLIGDEITFDDVERLLKKREKEKLGESPPYMRFSIDTPKGIFKFMVLNPRLSPEFREKITGLAEKKGIRILKLEDAPSKFRGRVCQEFLAEKYHTIRWNFEWKNYVILGVPDGITEKFVYEFKTTGSDFLLRHIKHCALVQADLYGYFFKRENKRVQVYILRNGKTVTWQEKVDEKEAVSLLEAFKQLDETGEAIPPERWKCKSCKFKNTCSIS